MAKRFNPKSISDAKLIEAIKKLSKSLGRTPSQADMKKYGCPLTKRVHLYRQRFGSIQNAQERAGLTINKSGSDMKYSDYELLDQIKSVGRALRRTPSQAEIVSRGKYPIGAYKRRFGTYNNAVEKAGLIPNTNPSFEIDDIKKDIIRVRDLLGHSPGAKEFNAHTMTVTDTTAIAMAGLKWNELVKECGIVPRSNRNISDVELKNELIRLKKELGYTPGYHDMEMFGKYAAETYSGRFGTYIKALEHFGFDYTEHNQWKNSSYSRGRDGIIYRSRFESGVANILFNLKRSGEITKYEYEKDVCDGKKWSCDFFVIRDGKQYWIETDGMGRARDKDYIDNNEKIKYYIKNDFNYHIIEYKKDVKRDLFAILFDSNNYDIEKVLLNYNLKKRKKKWVGDVDFPKTKNIKSPLNCPLHTKIKWKDHILTSRYLKSIDEDTRDEIAKDLLNYFIDYDFGKLRYDQKYLDNDLSHLKNIRLARNNGNIVNTPYHGTAVCKKYFPNILSMRGRKNKSILSVVRDKDTLFKVIRNRIGNTYLDGKDNRQSPFNITPAMILQGAKTSGLAFRGSIFNPMLAKEIYCHWIKDGDVVYDYSSGFGSRLLGFWACGKNAKYIGTDVEPATYSGLKQMASDFSIDADIYNVPSEDLVLPETIDFAFSSPPYFDHEIYSDSGNQSGNKYSNYEDWLNNYWHKTVRNIKEGLRGGGIFAINVGNNNNKKMRALHDDLNQIIIDNGFSLSDTWYVQSNSFNYKKNFEKRSETIEFYSV